MPPIGTAAPATTHSATRFRLPPYLIGGFGDPDSGRTPRSGLASFG
jgi:hypothetical protein